jgi:hypothetical protein
MNPKALPSKSLLQQMRDTTVVNRLFTDAREPHLIFLKQDISRRMIQEMLEINMKFEDFIEQACVAYINQLDNEAMAEEQYVDFNDVLQMKSIENKK